MASLENRGSAPLGTHLAKHLLRRATYNISKARIDEFAALNVDEALNRLLDYGSNTTIIPDIQELSLKKPLDYGKDPIVSSINNNEDYTYINSNGLSKFQLNRLTVNWYLNEAKNATTLRFKLTTFLHSIFIVNAADANKEDVYEYILYLLYYSKRSYKEFAYKIALSNRMLVYLNTQNSNKDAPNEDFPREFLELFTITRGAQEAGGVYANYTEEDVQAAARVLTGFRTNRGTTPDVESTFDTDTGIRRGRTFHDAHDTGDKTFSPKFGGVTITGTAAVADADGDTDADMLRELQDFVAMIFNQEETAKVICRRMYRFFVRRNIDTEVERDIIVPLATILRNNNYDIEITIRALLSSKHFYDEDDAVAGDEIIGALVKTPLDLLLHSFNLLEVTIDLNDLPGDIVAYHTDKLHWYVYSYASAFLNKARMHLFNPDNVAGYKPIYQEPDYDKQWYAFNTIGFRTAITKSMIDNKRYLDSSTPPTWQGVDFDVVDFVKNSGVFSEPRNSEVLLDEIIELLLVGPLEDFRRAYFYDILLQGLGVDNWLMVWDDPNDENLRIHLIAIFEAIMTSVEYQIL